MKEFRTNEDEESVEDDFFKSGKGLYGGRTKERREFGMPPRLSAHPLILDPFGNNDAVNQWKDFTKGPIPLEFEIGFGPGAFMASRSSENLERLFLAFEVRTKQCAELLERLSAAEQQNVRVVQTDARPVLRDFIDDGRLSDIHVNFPDPWWKKRHHKRRIFTPGFIDVAREKLESKGTIWLRTDVEAYALHVRTLFADIEDFESEEFGPDELQWTHRERKCNLYGLPVYRLRFRKRD